MAGLGVPTDVVDLCHRNNVLVMNMCGKVLHAIARRRRGVRHRRGPGHRGRGPHRQVAALPLVPQIVDAVGDRVPVVAAGGIFDGRGLAAALALGADGVWVGTRFIATPEARAVPGYKDALLRTGEDGTVVSRAFTGKTLRAVRNTYTDYYEQHPDELAALPGADHESGQAGAFHLGGDENTEVDPTRSASPRARESVRSTHLIPAADLVRQMVAEAEAALDRMAEIRTTA